jgi:hypothetical protein
VLVVIGHEIAADQQEVVTDRQDGIEKGSKFLYFIFPCVFCWHGIIVAVAGRCAASTLTATHPSLQIL